MKNRYARRAKISEEKLRQIIDYYVTDLDASRIAKLTDINRNTVNRYIMAIRERIAVFCEEQSPLAATHRAGLVCPPPGGGPEASGKGTDKHAVMIGLFKRDHKIYTDIVPAGNRVALLEVMYGRTNLNSITLPCDGQGYDAVVEMRQGRFMRIDHRHRPMVQGRTQQPIDELENFWSFAKGHLAKFRGVSAGVLHLHLKECEFRFNYRNQDLAPIVLEILLKEPLF